MTFFFQLNLDLGISQQLGIVTIITSVIIHFWVARKKMRKYKKSQKYIRKKITKNNSNEKKIP
jgi:uncharacterized membrane protein (DUF106 family)